MVLVSARVVDTSILSGIRIRNHGLQGWLNAYLHQAPNWISEWEYPEYVGCFRWESYVSVVRSQRLD